MVRSDSVRFLRVSGAASPVCVFLACNALRVCRWGDWSYVPMHWWLRLHLSIPSDSRSRKHRNEYVYEAKLELSQIRLFSFYGHLIDWRSRSALTWPLLNPHVLSMHAVSWSSISHKRRDRMDHDFHETTDVSRTTRTRNLAERFELIIITGPINSQCPRVSWRLQGMTRWLA